MGLTLAQENPVEWEITQVTPKPKLMDDDVFYPLGVLIEYAEAGMDISELRVIPEDQMAPSAGRERGLQRNDFKIETR